MLVVAESHRLGLTVVKRGEVCWGGTAVNLFTHDRGGTVVL
jgi:hypothetical protein